MVGIVLYEAGPSPADARPIAGTPVTIEFRERARAKQKDSTNATTGPGVEATSSLMSTEHAGNVSPNLERELT